MGSDVKPIRWSVSMKIPSTIHISLCLRGRKYRRKTEWKTFKADMSPTKSYACPRAFFESHKQQTVLSLLAADDSVTCEG